MMTSQQLRDAFAENPEFLLALILSTPYQQLRAKDASVTIDFHDGFPTSIRQHTAPPPAPPILASKQTIFDAIYLYGLLSNQDNDNFAEDILRSGVQFAQEAAVEAAEFEPQTEAGFYPSLVPYSVSSIAFIQRIGSKTAPEDFQIALQKTQLAFSFLESQGLVIDPWFSPQALVLLGLVPMQFSVRTIRGEEIYREFDIEAPLWSLTKTKGSVDFKFRGIYLVRNLLTQMATQFLEADAQHRHTNEKPVLASNGSPKLNPR